MMTRKVTGIGCFAKPETLSRVFKKMVQSYTLGEFENINPLTDHENLRRPDNFILLDALITGSTGYSPTTDSETIGNTKDTKVTGFFLTLRNQQLKLSIFAKGSHNSRERYTTTLAGYTKLRQKRLN